LTLALGLAVLTLVPAPNISGLDVAFTAVAALCVAMTIEGVR
jgi:hypothetical protein